MEKILFPFAGIVGQEEMKRALILNVIDPGIGGILIKGEKGTAKSTAVRSMSQILPDRTAVKGCVFHCDHGNSDRMCTSCAEKYATGKPMESAREPMRVIELPLSATEDRVAGTLDIEHVLKTGVKKFEPGVLAQANGNILYVDEVNLLDDHIVDLLLDSAAMGINYVEREGISFSHPSRFVLVGTMNPEEGELRPQLLDRFGLSVEVKGEKDTKIRAEVVKRRLAFDRDPRAYYESFAAETDRLRQSISDARGILRLIPSDDDAVEMVVTVTLNFGIDGHRADITMMKAAKANAALNGRTNVCKQDIVETAGLVLSHRMKRRPFEEANLDLEELGKCLKSL